MWSNFRLVLFLSIIFVRMRSEPTPCLLRCKDDHMLQVQKPLGEVTESSSEFLFPVETILRSSITLNDVIKKVDSSCRLNVEYHHCLSRCAQSKEQKLLVMGLKPWMYMCKSGKKPGIQTYLPCLWTHTNTLEQMCSREMNQLKSVFTTLIDMKAWQVQNFRHLCGSLYDYDECYLKGVVSKCGRETAKFLKGLTDVNNATLLELFSSDQNMHKILPPECFKERTSGIQIKRDQLNSTQGSGVNSENLHGKVNVNDMDYSDVDRSWGKENFAHKSYCFGGAIFTLLTFVNVCLLQLY